MDKIGPFQVVETIHRGSQPLFRARGKEGQELAVKTIPLAGLTPETRERFIREAETCKTLDHPNLIRVSETGEADGIVVRGPYPFYCETFALEIDHGSFLARYGEIQSSTDVHAGSTVRAGQAIARVGH